MNDIIDNMKNSEFIKYLEHRYDDLIHGPDIQGKYGVFHQAIKNNDLTQLKLLLQDPEISPNILDRNGNTALHYAVKYSNKEIVSLLLNSPKTDPNILDRNGNTALHYAVKYSNEEIVSLLIQSPKTDPNILDKNGNTGLYLAIYNGNKSLVKILGDYSNKAHEERALNIDSEYPADNKIFIFDNDHQLEEPAVCVGELSSELSGIR